MPGEPAGREVRHLLERSGLLEQVGRPGNDLDPALAPELCVSLAVEVEDDLVRAAYDQQVGAWTSASRRPARSGRPPRDTIAATGGEGLAAAHSAAAAPVLAPK
jgi:hypothetical protein